MEQLGKQILGSWQHAAVEVSGRKFEGRYRIEGRMLRVSYGKASTIIDPKNSDNAGLAKTLLRGLIFKAKGRSTW